MISKPKIYFAASIRGGQNDREIYALLIKELQRYGTVLTEHIVAATTTHLGSSGNVKDIYTQDMQWLSESNVVVLEVTQPSLGVGYELAQAEIQDKKILCLYRPQPGKDLSAMVAGNPQIKVKSYVHTEEAFAILKDFFSH